MLEAFFQTTSTPPDQLIGTYQLSLVFLSYIVAVTASYVALDITGQLRNVSNTQSNKWLWLIGGSIAMGAGIWSMHFIGMLSFSIPGLSLRYDLFWTIISLLVAIIASGFALRLLQAPVIRIEHYIAGGLILGLAIASMHYTGMQAMLISLDIHYLPFLFFLSIFIAIVASDAAIWLALKSTKVIFIKRNRIKIVSAIIMGVAICGMHYTGMAASVFTPLCAPSTVTGEGMDQTYLSIAIATVTFIILGIALFLSSYKEALNQQLVEKARQMGIAEISASVLHSVGNVLNSVSTSANVLSERISSSKLSNLEKLWETLSSHKDDLAQFLTEDPIGKRTLDFLKSISDYWHEERMAKLNEIQNLTKNLTLIQEIISTQQTLSKSTDLHEILDVNALLDEAILISGLNIKKEIILKKQFQDLPPIKTDKIKLLQIFINILRNAKDAVLESKKDEKIISITTSTIAKKMIKIEISDNGVGIPPQSVNRIFNYGFTTKKSGHGFGLHTSAIDMNMLGGEIQVVSEGKEKGATFILKI